MTLKIVAVLLLVGFFFLLSKAGAKMIGEENPLAKAFPIGATILVAFLLGLMFFSE